MIWFERVKTALWRAQSHTMKLQVERACNYQINHGKGPQSCYLFKKDMLSAQSFEQWLQLKFKRITETQQID